VAALRRQGVNATIAGESARHSYYLATRTISPEMEIEILGLQIVEEMRASLTADIVVCDRSVLDTFAYCIARFPGQRTPQDQEFLDSIADFGRTYIGSYRRIFFLSAGAPPPLGDPLRDSDPVCADEVSAAFERAIATWQTDVFRVDRDTALETVTTLISSEAQASRCPASKGEDHGYRSD
jgi:hypothetical protein